ncbi:MAG: NAD(P)H-hydrate dehydratase [Elusimicrobiota bacterium]
MKIISPSEMVRLDKESPVEAIELMERAGRGMARFIYSYFPRMPVVFFCGRGNNGGDGIVAARWLNTLGYNTEVCFISSKELKGLPSRVLKKYKGRTSIINNPEDIKYILSGNEIAVDCILGTGFKPPLRKNVGRILEIINKNSKIILSCDIPTGVDGSTGEADKNAVKADATVSFEYPKTGQIINSGSKFAGSIETVKIGTGIRPEEYLKEFELICRDDCRAYFKKRNKFSHKNNYGHVMVIGGKKGMEGAPSMSAAGALKSGAGLVTCAVSDKVYPNMPQYSLSSMALLLKGREEEGNISFDSAGKILEFAEKRKITSAVIGPGLGACLQSKRLVFELVKKLKCPVVIDADGLNVIAGKPDILKERKKRSTVLTPHPGEMRRLCGSETDMSLNEAAKTAAGFALKYSLTLVLKGYRTIVTNGKKTFINSSGNPAMAVGGSGDILSGIIGTLAAQHNNPLEAAKTGVWVHGRAGDLAAWNGSERSALPEDFLAKMEKV